MGVVVYIDFYDGVGNYGFDIGVWRVFEIFICLDFYFDCLVF